MMKEYLDDLLRSWRPEAVEVSSFKRDVWRRIEQRRDPTQRLEGFLEWLARPQIASLAAALAMTGGMLIGSVFASHHAQRAYLHEVDPYAQVVLK
jgi:hypothetical protein